MRRNGLGALLLAVVVVISMVVGGVITAAVTGGDDAAPAAVSSPEGSATPTTLPALQTTDDATASPAATAALAAINDLPGLVDQVEPSVVQIQTQTLSGSGVGSGVVIDRSGHILTNYHVIEGATAIQVLLPDGTAGRAEVSGYDQGNDLAVILADLPSSSLFPVTFGDSDEVRLGEPVFAIGNPFQLDFTVTSGIISGIDRESQQRPNGRAIRGVLQTDAAVNPGNSGGPLFNANGEVIGINTAVENPIGQNFFVGIGYAVPSNTAVRYIPDMITGATISHPQLGVSGVALNALSAQDADVNVEQGVYVTTVVRGSAADRAGITAANVPDGTGVLDAGGDVIVAADGVELTGVRELARVIDDHNVGDDVTLTIVRDGQSMDIVVQLLEWPG